MANRSHDWMANLEQTLKKDFESTKRLLSFDEYIHLVSERPKQQLRGTAQYAVDMIDFFGTEEIEPGLSRFKVFNASPDQTAKKVVGHETIQSQIYSGLKTFARQGLNNKLLLLHGPNGSAKSSLIQSLMTGLEHYSLSPEGAVYTFNWIFPLERYTKGGMGLNTYADAKDLSSYAKLPEEEVSARIPCDLKDHPLLLIPSEQRKQFLETLLGKAEGQKMWDQLPQVLIRGNPCHRCKQIFDSLLVANSGDFKKVLMHVQVERVFLSRRYRRGLVTIEPQLHVDASYQQLTMNRSMGALPASLQGLNLFTVTGDLIDGNRGLIEFSDLLKRPIDSFKYLLMACETNSVNVGPTIAFLDTLWLGSANELQLDAFKEFPDFTSFKARIELIRVPYLLSAHEEKEIYAPDLEQINREKHVTPHTDWTLAMWAVLTRLKKPNSINYPPNISTVVSNLSPIEKARLYDTGEMPVTLTAEERKLLKSSLKKIKEEYSNIPYYEGRMGASAREVRGILYEAAQNAEFHCVSPLAVLREMENFCKRVSEYEFLKQDVKDGFHDANEFVSVVRKEYLTRIDREVRDSIGLYDSAQWEDFLKKYVQHVAIALKKEKIKNPITGKMEDPDFALIDELEKIIDAPSDAAAKESFRQNIISQVGAWSLDHANSPVIYAKVFPEFWSKLEKHYYESQKSTLTKMHNALVIYDRNQTDAAEEGSRLAHQTVTNMVKKLGYCEHCAKEVITFLMRSRYHD